MITAVGGLSLQPLRTRAAGFEAATEWDSACLAYGELYHAALRATDFEEAVAALRGQARACRELGRLGEAEEYAELSYEIALKHGLLRDAARAVNTTATIRFMRQDIPGAVPLYDRALALARDVGDDELIGLAAQNLGIIHHLEGDLALARAFYLESIAASLRAGDARSELVAYMHLGVVCGDLGEWLQAELYLERAQELADRIEHRMLIASVCANLAWALIGMGELDRAETALKRAESYAHSFGYPGARSQVERRHATLARLRGDHDSAQRHIDRALEFARDENLDLERAETLEELANLRVAQGRPQLARAALREAGELYGAAHATGWKRRVADTLARLDDPDTPPSRAVWPVR